MESIDKIYNQYANLIKNYIYHITGDKDLADDIMQETFVSAINQINNFRGDCEIYVWLCSIAKKILYKQTKKHKYNTISIDDIENEIELSNLHLLEDECIKTDDKLRLYEALQKLDINTREVIYLRLTGDLTFKEISAVLHKSENWARVTFFRGKQKLVKENLL